MADPTLKRTSSTSSQGRRSSQGTLVGDLIEKETQYIEQLKTLKEYYLLKIKDHSPIEVIPELIEMLRSMLEFHSILQKNFSRHSEPRDIGETLIENKSKFQNYAPLASKIHIFSVGLNDMVTADKKFRESIANLVGQCPMKSITLFQLLERPEIRLREYANLLDRLKILSPSDFDVLDLAGQMIKEIIANLDQIKADQLISQKITYFQTKINGLPCDRERGLTGYGRIVTEGKAKFKYSNEPQESERYLILFDKIILICKPLGGRTYDFNGGLVVNDFSYHGNWPEISSGASTSSNSETGTSSSQPPSSPNQAFLKSNGCGCIHTITFYSEAMKKGWIECFQKALDNCNPSPCHIGDCKHGFLQKSYPINTPCDLCHKTMLGNIYQGYSCVKCSVNVHKECIGNKTLKKCQNVTS